MAGNTFGQIFKLTTFGESHGSAIGGIIDGCPAGLTIDFDFVQNELARRKPGQSSITTQRKEDDVVEFLSGIFEGKTLGTPIGFIIKNNDQQPKDYELLKETYRPSHADFTYDNKYGIRDYRGGGRSSARETACRIVAGAIAKLILKVNNITVSAFVKQVGEIKLNKNFDELDLSKTENNLVRCPDENIAKEMIAYIEKLKTEGDTTGGIIQCVVLNTPIGLGEPVFDKLHAVLGHAMLSINAVKGFEIGSGFDSIHHKGSELNDEFVSSLSPLDSARGDKPLDSASPSSGQAAPIDSIDVRSSAVETRLAPLDFARGDKPLDSASPSSGQAARGDKITTKTNNSGGIQGGISNGMPIYFNIAFKPVATIMKSQNTVNKAGEEIKLAAKGRHDPCVLPRAVPIVESMAALVMVDFWLLSKLNKI